MYYHQTTEAAAAAIFKLYKVSEALSSLNNYLCVVWREVELRIKGEIYHWSINTEY